MQSKTINVALMDIQAITVTIEGETPLIVNRFSEKSKEEILGKQTKKAKTGKEARNPEKEYLSSLYSIDHKRTGFPAYGIKAAIVRAAKSLGMVMVDVRTNVHIVAPKGNAGLIEIHGPHQMREDVVRIGNGISSLAFRAEYPEWVCTFEVKYNASMFSADQIATLIQAAGFSCGLGEWRPNAPKSNSGTFGMFNLKVA